MKKSINNQNAKEALNQMKLEISNELGVEGNHNGASKSAYQNGVIGGKVGGQMSKRLVEMGEEILLSQYNNKK